MTDSDTHELGIRIDPVQGVAFFGIEAVNRQLALGRRVKEIRPGGAIMTKLGENEGHVRMTLGGCDIVVVFEAEDDAGAT
ncbi:hypothetical protein DB30_03726 [Enhygromyxa salina]|uniref:Uncharacterized protein n=1 Tax=Enhygromyxa salina TaxID=215803 RepID=A0A0C1ZHQ3_9BACT|nr:hypothetical protein [Enhygromyxa salina]KIG17129.1 hypothetical protein DB30_03726 [Enhygromyxa salina]